MSDEPIAGETLPVDCPFCGAALGIAHDPPAVMHGLPMCEKFKLDDPITFLRRVRQAMEDG